MAYSCSKASTEKLPITIKAPALAIFCSSSVCVVPSIRIVFFNDSFNRLKLSLKKTIRIDGTTQTLDEQKIAKAGALIVIGNFSVEALEQLYAIDTYRFFQ